MLRDLALDETPRAVETETVIIGGGIAGLVLATKLRARKARVVVLESGGRAPIHGVDPLNRVVQVGEDYRGAAEGRARGLGGTSTIWGGALIPFLAQDLEARPHVHLPAWPITLQELQPYVPELEQLFRIDAGPYEAPLSPIRGRAAAMPVADGDFMTRFAKWPTFKRRNVATLFKRQIETDADLSVWLNATATAFDHDEGGRLTGIVAHHASGRSLRVSAQNVVVCAGAIEATRLMLLLDRQSGGKIFHTCSALGHYLHDHVSTQVADIQATDPRALNQLAGYHFARSTMRSLRFELSPSSQALERVGSAFGHITFRSDRETGFDALQDFMRSLQRTGKIDLGSARRVARDVPYLMRVGYWRYVHGQLRWPEPARYQLHVVAEQTPRRTSRISLSAERDPFDLPLAEIDWRVDPADRATVGAFARRFDAYWRRQGWTDIGQLNWFRGAREGHITSFTQVGGLFHPGGTTRMGLDGHTAVVDRDLRTFAVPNLWVASTSAFPSGASANPTMMLMLFALRLADHLARR
jgi:choline dehydrogenase-like flavoprotein